ncbi:MAG: hypothetical protein RBT47_05935 [Anaerolineae bacterium]|jgi:hypothetical protein|nr:hypothetical protein [Anaerolineae bacterium]
MVEIQHPLNREILLYMKMVRTMNERDQKPGETLDPKFVPEAEMTVAPPRTHPDLGGLLAEVGRDLPGVTHGYVLGYDVLINAQGIIFAVAMSMNLVALRLGPADPPSEETPVAELGSLEKLRRGWMQVDPCATGLHPEKLKAHCAEALANVDVLVQG